MPDTSSSPQGGGIRRCKNLVDICIKIIRLHTPILNYTATLLFSRSEHAVTDRFERSVPVVSTRDTRQLVQFRRQRHTFDVRHAVH